MIEWWFYLLFALIAFLYTAAGLGGGSAYVAVLALSGLPHYLIPPTALFLNTLASGVSFSRYYRYLHSQRLPLYLSVYACGIGGVLAGSALHLEEKIFYILTGGALTGTAALSMVRDIFHWRKSVNNSHSSHTTDKLPHPLLLGGASVLAGVLAGTTGIGGGVYLAPILLVAGLPTKEIAAMTSLYTFLNSASGFLSHYLQGNASWQIALPPAVAVLVGALPGSYIGAVRWSAWRGRLLLTLIVLAMGVGVLFKAI